MPFTTNGLIKYILFALIVGAILKFAPNANFKDEEIMQYALIAALVIFVLDIFVFQKKEGYETVKNVIHVVRPEEMSEEELPEQIIEEEVKSTCDMPPDIRPVPESYHELVDSHEGCDRKHRIPGKYGPTHQQEDLLKTGLHYDHNKPGYYLLCNGEFAGCGVPFSEAAKLICKSKLKDLYEQHNHNIPCSSHSHFGKNRGYLNWENL